MRICPALLMAMFAGALPGCTPNEALRVSNDAVVDCAIADCNDAVIEKHKNFDLAFVEFTDRGNLFSRSRYDEVVSHIDEKVVKGRVAVIVFVHGWRHNASHDDANVQSFRDVLDILSEMGAFFGRRPIGVYVGWRGLSATLPGLEQLSFWDRKAVTQQVGKGGVTEVLLRLNQVTSVKSNDPGMGAKDNMYVVIGHSFGGAIVLSALGGVFIDRMIAAPQCVSEAAFKCKTELNPAECEAEAEAECVRAIGIGQGVVLINPAIEANDGFQIKELSTLTFPNGMNPLLHVISTDGDKDTRKWFPLGQKLGLITWKQAELQRQYGNQSPEQTFSEVDLDETTVGNFAAFHTARLTFDKKNKAWDIKVCREYGCEQANEEWERYMEAGPNNPISFVSTDASFMTGHSDIFNCNVTAYIAAIVEKTRVEGGEVPLSGCVTSDRQFNTLECFKAYHTFFSNEFDDEERQRKYPKFCPAIERTKSGHT